MTSTSNGNTLGTAGDTCIRIRGLPWSAREDDLRNFFADCATGIVQIHFTFTRDGRPSGEAYVEFTNPEDAQQALSHHNQHIGKRYIEKRKNSNYGDEGEVPVKKTDVLVPQNAGSLSPFALQLFSCKKSEMEYVVKHSKGPESGEESILRLRGLPFGTTKEEVTSFFGELPIVPNGILLPVDVTGRSTGEAFVQFADKDTAEKAMEKHMEKIGSRYIEIFRSSQEEVKSAMFRLSMGGGPFARGRPGPYDRPGSGMYSGRRGGGTAGAGGGGMYGSGGGMMGGGGGFMGGGGMGMGGGGYGAYGMTPNANPQSLFGGYDPYGAKKGHIVHMRGLPFRATESHIREFFSPLQIANVTFGFDYSGRPSGEADVEFFSHNDAVEAMKKDRDTIGERYIELFLNSTAVDKAPSVAMGGVPGMFGTTDYSKDEFP